MAKNLMVENQFTIIFTDLDGTLLDHSTYSFEAARPALEIIKKRRIPLIICTSKTSAEIIKTREELHNPDPFVSENGGGIFIPRDYFPFSYPFHRQTPDYRIIELGVPHEKLVESLHRIRETTELPLKGFSMMEAGEIAQLCGFSYQDALLARQREYDEPFIIISQSSEPGFEEDLLQEAVKREGLWLTKGGRFYHLKGPNNKGMAVQMLINLFRHEHPKVVSIALGDSHNDTPMLKEAEVAILIQKKDGSYEDIDQIAYHPSDAPGPSGWNSALLRILGEDS